MENIYVLTQTETQVRMFNVIANITKYYEVLTFSEMLENCERKLSEYAVKGLVNDIIPYYTRLAKHLGCTGKPIAQLFCTHVEVSMRYASLVLTDKGELFEYAIYNDNDVVKEVGFVTTIRNLNQYFTNGEIGNDKEVELDVSFLQDLGYVGANSALQAYADVYYDI